MKNAILKLCISIFTGLCVYPSFGREVPVSAVIEGDSATISVKINSSCKFPDKIKFVKYSVWDMGGAPGDFPALGKDSVYRYRTSDDGLQEIIFFVNYFRYDVFTSHNEKNCLVEISCNGREQKEEVTGSDETKAWTRLNDLAKLLNDTLKGMTKDRAIDNNSFPSVKNLLLDYQQKVSVVMHDYPNTRTAKVLCASEILPASTLSSLKSLRENYLNREAFASTDLYGTMFLSNKIFDNYFQLLDRYDTTFSGFAKALDIAGKNTETAKLLQQMMFNHFYMWIREQAMLGYMNWANRNPDKMINLVVKARMKNLEGSMPGNMYTDIMLPDTTGTIRKLSETLAGSRLTVLIFYSPTCAHCNEKLPKLLPDWNKFKDKGLRIYAVAQGQDATQAQWHDFIHKRATGEWVNVYKEGNTPESGIKYNIGPIPSFILIDPHGKILSRMGTIESMLDEIPKYFGQ